MTVYRLSPVPLFVVCFALLCHAALGAGEQPPGADPPREIAKAPTEESVSARGDPSGAPVAVQKAAGLGEVRAEEANAEAAPRASTPPEKEFRIALAWDPTPPPGSAADLMELAAEYRWNGDHETEASYLEQAADLGAGAAEGGTALCLLARAYYDLTRDAEAEAALAAVGSDYPGAETRAFARVVGSLCAALEGSELGAAAALLAETADTWSGTGLGAWAALESGNLHRDHISDLDAAIAYYEKAAAAYAGTLTADEAEVAIGECLAWTWERTGEASQALDAALAHITNPRLRVRAIIALGDALQQAGQRKGAFDVFSSLIEQSPDHPSVPEARAYRSIAARGLGRMDVAAADAEAFLAAPRMHERHPNWVSVSWQVLAQAAYQAGDIEAAEARFRSALAAAVIEQNRSNALAGIGSCQRRQGELVAATESFLQAAEHQKDGRARCILLYEAACTALQAGDTAAANEAIALMVEQFPGQHLTTMLVGHEVLRPPDI